MNRRTVLTLVRSALAVTIVAGVATAAVGVALARAAVATPALTTAWYASAPYLMPFDNSPPDPLTVMGATGQRAFQLAFILAPASGGCSPTWDGSRPVATDTQAAALIARIRAAGGDVSVSVGGYGGTKLGQTCASPAATAAAYQQVVSAYGLRAIDLDLEEPEYENAAAVHNELGAAQILQQNNPGLYVSITTAGTAAGTGWFGQQLLNDAHGLGFTPANYSIMPFDGGFAGGASQVSALEAFHGLLMTTFGWDSATAYAHEGVSMMNGRSDAGEYFQPSDFQAVLDYATGHHLARYTFWSVNRDRQCADPNQGTTSGTCSSVPQTPWQFTTFTSRFAGATPPTSPPPTTGPPTTGPPTTGPPTTGPPTTSCSASAWSATNAYTGGQLASYNGRVWRAQWWTQGEVPGVATVWVDQGACGGPTTAPPGRCAPAAWSSTTAYIGGAVVAYANHTWTARWWTQGDIPGNNGQAVWTDNGPC